PDLRWHRLVPVRRLDLPGDGRAVGLFLRRELELDVSTAQGRRLVGLPGQLSEGLWLYDLARQCPTYTLDAQPDRRGIVFGSRFRRFGIVHGVRGIDDVVGDQKAHAELHTMVVLAGRLGQTDVAVIARIEHICRAAERIVVDVPLGELLAEPLHHGAPGPARR